MIRSLSTVLIGIMIFLSGLLFYEYLCLKQQVQRVVEIQEEYQTYTVAFKKILRDYQRIKEGEEDVFDEDGEKKKEQSFLVVNREPNYLRRSAARYMRAQRMESYFNKMYPHYDEQQRSNIISSRLGNNSTRFHKRSRRTHRGKNLLAGQLARHQVTLKNRLAVKDIHFEWPIDRSQFWISSFYGARRKPDRTWGFHHGIDMAAIKGTPVNAVLEGIVVEAGNNKGYGNTIVIMHNKKYRTRYAHLHRIYVRVGQTVSTSQCIGAVGDTGLVRKRGRYASHLHFEVYVFGKRVNPIYFFV